MPSYEIKPLQDRILSILVDVDLSFRKEGLRYYIIAGTLLGAIRHKGFIPWDDDIDIAMPRPDYDRLMAHFQQILPEHLEVVAYETDKNYPLPFAKIQDNCTTLIERFHLHYLGGIYIDVFPLDGVSNNQLSRRLHFMKYEFWKRVLYFVCRDPYKHGHGISSWLPLLSRRFFSLQQVQKKLRRLQKEHDFDKSEYIVDHDDGMKGVMPRHLLGTPTPYIFDNHTFLGPEKAADYLSQKYGNYMEIPKDADKHQHNFDFLDLNLPYRDYKIIAAPKS